LGFAPDLDEESQLGLNPTAKTETFFHMRTHRQVELIKALNEISFIACGDNHSCAVQSTNKDKEKELKLFTWGWGAYG
jgi:alpha-tubulin suppressor-like RCC1 family protein